tara:strand:- start:16 stop:1410 length:1395 start_codon:yes stop_codon:yes gene_type:complete
MSVIPVTSCCCGGSPPTKVKLWVATKCSPLPPCAENCDGSEASCVASIDFCDAYRASIGLPNELDSGYCYFMVYGGCHYLVGGYSLVASCSSTPTNSHNVGSFIGPIVKPTEGCASYCNGTFGHKYSWGPEVWVGGFTCASTLTATYDWTGVSTSGCTPFDDCAVDVGTIASEWHIGVWPNFIHDVNICQPDPMECEMCVQGVPPVGLQYPGDDISPQLAVGSNYCNPDDPVSDPCNFVFNAKARGLSYLTSILYPALPEELIYEIGFVITRSCAHPAGPTFEWLNFGQGTNVSIDGCQFDVDLKGGSANGLAVKVNEILGTTSSAQGTTFSASGSPDAWIGPACVSLDGDNICTQCQGSVVFWSDPIYSNGGKTATVYYANQTKVTLVTYLVCQNYSAHLISGGPCVCTGGPRGFVFGHFISDPDSDPFFKHGTIITGSDFTMINDPVYDPPDFPCTSPPTIS